MQRSRLLLSLSLVAVFLVPTMALHAQYWNPSSQVTSRPDAFEDGWDAYQKVRDAPRVFGRVLASPDQLWTNEVNRSNDGLVKTVVRDRGFEDYVANDGTVASTLIALDRQDPQRRAAMEKAYQDYLAERERDPDLVGYLYRYGQQAPERRREISAMLDVMTQYSVWDDKFRLWEKEGESYTADDRPLLRRQYFDARSRGASNWDVVKDLQESGQFSLSPWALAGGSAAEQARQREQDSDSFLGRDPSASSGEETPLLGGKDSGASGGSLSSFDNVTEDFGYGSKSRRYDGPAVTLEELAEKNERLKPYVEIQKRMRAMQAEREAQRKQKQLMQGFDGAVSSPAPVATPMASPRPAPSLAPAGAAFSAGITGGFGSGGFCGPNGCPGSASAPSGFCGPNGCPGTSSGGFGGGGLSGCPGGCPGD